MDMKVFWKSQEEIEKESEKQRKLDSLPKEKERIEALEKEIAMLKKELIK